MKSLIVLAVLATFAFAGATEFGPQLGYWIPTGDAGDVFAGNFYFGGQFLSHMPMFAIEGSIGYTSLKADPEDSTFSGRIIPITVGLRGYSGILYAAGGIELDMVKTESGVVGAVQENSDSEFGGYIGGGLITPLPNVADVDVSARVHFVDFDDMWIGLCVGLNF
ncbi:MAG: hypothetical protein J7K88_12515 [Candidatus Fermentibacteraceae bacterium]|nr:hypothetical protein [Candidatus Fermentibacteraceae bacterium]